MGFWEKVKGFMASPSAAFDGVRDEGWGTSFGFYAKLLVIFAILFITSHQSRRWYYARNNKLGKEWKKRRRKNQLFHLKPLLFQLNSDKIKQASFSIFQGI